MDAVKEPSSPPPQNSLPPLPAIDPLLKKYNSRINLKKIAEDDKMDYQDYLDMRRHMVSSNRSYQKFEVLKGADYIDKAFTKKFMKTNVGTKLISRIRRDGGDGGEANENHVATKKARKSRKVNLKRVTENQIVGGERDALRK